jgi:hypothetical protein
MYFSISISLFRFLCVLSTVEGISFLRFTKSYVKLRMSRHSFRSTKQNAVAFHNVTADKTIIKNIPTLALFVGIHRQCSSLVEDFVCLHIPANGIHFTQDAVDVYASMNFFSGPIVVACSSQQSRESRQKQHLIHNPKFLL